MRKLKSTQSAQGSRRQWRFLFGLMAVCLMAMSLVAVPAAIAEEETAEPTPTPEQTGSENDETSNPLYNTFMNRLAENLGIASDKLQSAIQQTEQEMIQQGIENGILPEEKAEGMQAYIEENGSLRGYGLSVAQERIHERLQRAVENGVIEEEKAQEIEQRFQNVREMVMERIQNRGALSEAWEDSREGLGSRIWNRVQERIVNSGTGDDEAGPPEWVENTPGVQSGTGTEQGQDMQNGPAVQSGTGTEQGQIPQNGPASGVER